MPETNKREPYVPNNPKYPWNYVVGLDKLHPFEGKKFGKETEFETEVKK